MDYTTHFATNIICWVENGEVYILFIDTSPIAQPEKMQSKTPGGMSHPGESPKQTAIRETTEETGLVVMQDARIIPAFSYQVADHLKTSFLTPRLRCVGNLLSTPFEDGNWIIHRIYPIRLEEAENKVYQTEWNQFYVNSLAAVKEILKSKPDLLV